MRIQGRFESAIRHADRALSLADELGFPRPARALGYRGTARGGLGDPGGLDDMRAALVLATEAGQGREVCVLHNNLGLDLWAFEGPVASLVVMRAGIAFARSRGLAEAADATAASALDGLFEVGELDEALEIAAELDGRIVGEDVFDLIEVRSAQVRIHAMRGETEASATHEWLEVTGRSLPDPQFVVLGLGPSALARHRLGEDDRATSLLAELESTSGAKETMVYAAYVPAFVRTALAIGDSVLAGRLVDDLTPRYPYTEHALVATNAALTEARSDLAGAVDAYADAADRWERFGVVPEQAFALLGQGRCLVGLGRSTEAQPVLRRAREIFERLGAGPALGETDALIGHGSRGATTHGDYPRSVGDHAHGMPLGPCSMPRDGLRRHGRSIEQFA